MALRWLVRREYLITVRAVDERANVPRLPQARWAPIEDPTSWWSVPVTCGQRGPRSDAVSTRARNAGRRGWTASSRTGVGRPRGLVFLPYLGRTLRPEAGDLCVLDVYTVPRHRGRGLHTVGTFLALERARARGLTRLVGLVAWWNTPARHVMEGKTGRRSSAWSGTGRSAWGAGTSPGEESGSRATRSLSPPCARWARLAPLPRVRPDREPRGRRFP